MGVSRNQKGSQAYDPVQLREEMVAESKMGDYARVLRSLVSKPLDVVAYCPSLGTVTILLPEGVEIPWGSEASTRPQDDGRHFFTIHKRFTRPVD